LPELDVELIMFFLNMLCPPQQLGIKSHTKIFSCVGIWNFCAIDEDWLLFNLVVCEVNMYQFGFVELYSPLHSVTQTYTNNEEFRLLGGYAVWLL
jgi:hypothetical protein